MSEIKKPRKTPSKSLVNEMMSIGEKAPVPEKGSKTLGKSRGSSRPVGKDGMRQMCYYLSDELIGALNLRKARLGEDLSYWVRQALEKELTPELEMLDKMSNM